MPPSAPPAPRFAERLLAWAAREGRHDLPWQRERTPYRVWVSEIMLQQTQVGTVVGYFERFMARFPDLAALAAAEVDEVLHLWSGLGYYSRARNLHRAARQVVEHHGGRFPRDIDAVQALPGIGRSTAGAILAIACGQPHAILDGNVKRVLARHRGVHGWPGESAVARELWTLAEAMTPAEAPGAYAQAVMDLGATRCTRRNPACLLCPVADDCAVRIAGDPHALPTPRPRRARPVRATRFAIVRDARGRVLLERRGPAGVWAGLWGFPEFDTDTDPRRWCTERLGIAARETRALPGIRHGFTHYALDIEPWLIEVGDAGVGIGEADGHLWYDPGAPAEVGLAAPVARLLAQLAADTAALNGETTP